MLKNVQKFNFTPKAFLRYLHILCFIFCFCWCFYSDLVFAHFYAFDPNVPLRGLKLVQNNENSTIGTSSTSSASSSDFNALYTSWTQAFNNKDVNSVCALFSPDIIADYRGYYPRKRYSNICEDFKKIFADKDRTYSYRFKILEVYESSNFAAVRITWFLKIDESTTNRSYEMQEEGLDILQKINGEWKIVNYLGYPSA